jgi:hypothetical protein
MEESVGEGGVVEMVEKGEVKVVKAVGAVVGSNTQLAPCLRYY